MGGRHTIMEKRLLRWMPAALALALGYMVITTISCSRGSSETPLAQVDRPARELSMRRVSTITWYSNFDKAKEEAKRTGKPMMVGPASR